MKRRGFRKKSSSSKRTRLLDDAWNRTHSDYQISSPGVGGGGIVLVSELGGMKKRNLRDYSNEELEKYISKRRTRPSW